MTFQDILTIILALFGGALGARLTWHLKPPVQKEIDARTLQNLVSEAAKKGREELDYYLDTLNRSLISVRKQNGEQAQAMTLLARQNKDQQEQINQLRADQVEKQAQIDDLRHDQDEMKAAFEALEWSVNQEEVEISSRIETRAKEKRGKKE